MVRDWRSLKALGYVIVPCGDDCDDACKRGAPEYHDWVLPETATEMEDAAAPLRSADPPEAAAERGANPSAALGAPPSPTTHEIQIDGTIALEPQRGIGHRHTRTVDITADIQPVTQELDKVREVMTRVLPFYGPFQERDAAIENARRAGATFRQLAEASGMTSERCRQIVRKAEAEGRL